MVNHKPDLNPDDGVAGGHGLDHPGGGDVAGQGEHQEQHGAGRPASSSEGGGQSEGARADNKVEHEDSRSSGAETWRALQTWPGHNSESRRPQVSGRREFQVQSLAAAICLYFTQLM